MKDVLIQKRLCVDQKRSSYVKTKRNMVVFSFLLFLWISQLCFTLFVYADYGLKTTLVNPELDEDSRFGVSIGVTGDYLFIGADYTDIDEIERAGKVHVYDHEGEYIKYIGAEDPQTNDFYGQRIRVCENILYITCPNSTEGTPGWSYGVWPGQVYAYDKSGSFKFILKPPELDFESTFGFSVAKSMDSILVGEPENDLIDISQGRVLEFDLDGNYLRSHLSPEPQIYGHFGYNIITDDDIIAVLQHAGPTFDYVMDGSVFLFDVDWNLIKRIDYPLEVKNQFGRAMAVYEDYIYVANHNTDIEDKAAAGCIYVYDKQGEFVRTISAPEPKAVECFGESIVIQDDVLYVGAGNNDDETVDAGKVYVMDLTGELITELVSPEPVFKGFFGRTIAVFEDKIYVGEIGAEKVHIFEKGFSSTVQEEQTETETTTETDEPEPDNKGGIPGFPIISTLISILLISLVLSMRAESQLQKGVFH
jgi:outer membrane protein assembly factor BamB